MQYQRRDKFNQHEWYAMTAVVDTVCILLILDQHCVSFNTNSLECALLRIENHWMVPLPLYKGVVKQTENIFIESIT